MCHTMLVSVGATFLETPNTNDNSYALCPGFTYTVVSSALLSIWVSGGQRNLFNSTTYCGLKSDFRIKHSGNVPSFVRRCGFVAELD